MAGMNAKVITVFRGIGGMIKLRFSAVSCKLLKKTAGLQIAEVYINRAGKNLKPKRKKILEQTKAELRKLYA